MGAQIIPMSLNKSLRMFLIRTKNNILAIKYAERTIENETPEGRIICKEKPYNGLKEPQTLIQWFNSHEICKADIYRA